LEELRRLNGTPKAVLENEELMQLLIPILRADFAVAETYIYQTEPALECAHYDFGGLQDVKISHDHLEAWRPDECFLLVANVFWQPFLLHSAQPLLLQSLARELH